MSSKLELPPRSAPRHIAVLGCGCQAMIEVRLPAQSLCAVRIVMAKCGASTHTVGRRLITGLRG